MSDVVRSNAPQPARQVAGHHAQLQSGRSGQGAMVLGGVLALLGGLGMVLKAVHVDWASSDVAYGLGGAMAGSGALVGVYGFGSYRASAPSENEGRIAGLRQQKQAAFNTAWNEFKALPIDSLRRVLQGPDTHLPSPEKLYFPLRQAADLQRQWGSLDPEVRSRVRGAEWAQHVPYYRKLLEAAHLQKWLLIWDERTPAGISESSTAAEIADVRGQLSWDDPRRAHLDQLGQLQLALDMAAQYPPPAQ